MRPGRMLMVICCWQWIAVNGHQLFLQRPNSVNNWFYSTTAVKSLINYQKVAPARSDL